jgi:hypothetical protein
MSKVRPVLTFNSIIMYMAAVAIVLFALALNPVFAQDEAGGSAQLSSPQASPRVIFVTPPSYLDMLNAQARPRSIGSIPRLEAPTAPTSKVTVTYTTTSSSSARPQIKSTTTTTYVQAPQQVGYAAPLRSEQIKRGPVLEGFTVKHGKVRLRDLSTREPGGLNNKWLELKERELIENSMFEPPGSPPHVNPY